jgi:hypothetical protein
MLFVASLAALFAAFPAGAQAAGRHAPVMPTQAHPFGKSYAQWSALWWQQALAVDTSEPNAFDQGNAPCNLGTRKVVFLVGGTTPGSTAERSCTVRTGQAIFFPLLNGECSQLEGNGSSEAELRKCAADQADAIKTVFATVDGVPVRNLSRYRFQSPLFQFTTAENNPFGLPAGQTSPSVADGYWVMLHPLRPGVHTISFGGDIPGVFSTAATYTITVVRGHRP